MRPQLDLISQATHGISAILAVESLVPGSYGYENDDVGWHVEADPGVESRKLLVDGQAVLRSVRTGAESMTVSVLADLPPDIALVLQALGQEADQLTLTEEEFDHRTSCLDGIWCTWSRFNRARPGEATALTSEVLALAQEWDRARLACFNGSANGAVLMVALEQRLSKLVSSGRGLTKVILHPDPRGSAFTIEVEGVEHPAEVRALGRSWSVGSKPPMGPAATTAEKRGVPKVRASKYAVRPAKVDPAVRDALADASIDGTEVRLAGQLDSRLYAKVNALLIELGGRWHTGRQAHVFDHSPKDKLAAIAETGTVLTRKCYEFFWTPPELSSRLIQLLDLKPGMTMLEPHAGQGALAMAAAEVLGKDAITCYELMPENVSHLQRLGFSIEGPADFLEVKPGKLYSRIAANPPFSGGRDAAHMRHAFQFLEPGGLFAGITSTHWVKAKDASSRGFAQFVEEHAVHVEERPAGEFSAAGTDVPTMLVLLKRPNETAHASAKVTTALRFESADQLALFG